MITVRPFLPEDVDRIEPQHQQAIELATVGDWRHMTRYAAQVGPAWTGELDGRVIGCAGFAMRWQGRASAWFILGRDVPRVAWVGIHRAVRERIAQLPALGIWRLEAETAQGFVSGARWLEMLGFEHEGLARGYGPGGEDFRRYARVTL